MSLLELILNLSSSIKAED